MSVLGDASHKGWLSRNGQLEQLKGKLQGLRPGLPEESWPLLPDEDCLICSHLDCLEASIFPELPYPQRSRVRSPCPHCPPYLNTMYLLTPLLGCGMSCVVPSCDTVLGNIPVFSLSGIQGAGRRGCRRLVFIYVRLEYLL